MEISRNPKTEGDVTARAVAQAPARVAQLVHRLADAGIAAGGDTDLDVALTHAPALLVVDPDGWEASCRISLEGFERRGPAPPAVLFASSSPLVPQAAGPSFGVLADADGRDGAAAKVHLAIRAHRRFRPHWPALLQPFPPHEVKRLAALLEQNTGLEVRAEHSAVFVGKVRQRMVARQVPTAREYARVLGQRKGGAGEAEALAGLLSVAETYFWRYSGQFRALQSLLIPHLANQAVPPGVFRVWCAGCSTGEEVYSAAMACCEALPQGWGWEVTGTDLQRASLDAASRGVYSPRALRNLPSRLSRRYLVAGPAGARVGEELRAGVRFERLNLGGPGLGGWIEQHGPFDAIFCRNTLLYFTRSAAERILLHLQGGLARGGGLFLGASETLGAVSTRFRTVRGPGCFFHVKDEPSAPAATERPRGPPGGESSEQQIDAFYRRGLERAGREDFVGARESFRAILALDSEDGRGHTGLGLLLANEGRETEAVRHLTAAVRSGPASAEAHYLLGLVEERLGREQAALGHYQRTLERDGTFFMAHFSRAWIWRRAGRSDAFRAELEQVRSLLDRGASAPAWVTGGLSVQALSVLVRRELDGGAVSA